MPGGLIPPTEPTLLSLNNHSQTRELSNLLRRETIAPVMATGSSCSTLQNRPSTYVYPKVYRDQNGGLRPAPFGNASPGANHRHRSCEPALLFLSGKAHGPGHLGRALRRRREWGIRLHPVPERPPGLWA